MILFTRRPGGSRRAGRFALPAAFVATLLAGGSLASATPHATATAAPLAAPTLVRARSVGPGMLVTWRAPASTGGRKITGYVVTPHLHGPGRKSRPVLTTSRSKVFTTLIVGATYSFTVAAKTAHGVGRASSPSPRVRLHCVGVAMRRGQADINSRPGGTTFCLSGLHHWSLRPKSGDRLIGPAVLDGANAVRYAIDAGAESNVLVARVEIRKYTVANQHGAIFVPDKRASGWHLHDLRVHDNGTHAGGVGANLGTRWTVLGGRYWNNRQEGLGGSGPNSVVNSVELDHNNFTDDHYTTRNSDCAFEGGGFKWVADNITVKNSRVHNNACKGLWADTNSRHAVILGNQVANNWDEGIFIEISSGMTITNNTVTGNGFKTTSGNGHGCPWLWGGGITLASSGPAVVAHNTVSGNCNGVTGTQQHRPEGHPGLLQQVTIRDNTISGPGGRTGVVQDNGANLASRHITFANNRIRKGMGYCRLSC